MKSKEKLEIIHDQNKYHLLYSLYCDPQNTQKFKNKCLEIL